MADIDNDPTSSLHSSPTQLATLAELEQGVAAEADSTLTTTLAATVGNQADAAVAVVGTTDSLMAYVKGIVNLVIAAGTGTIGAVDTAAATGAVTDTDLAMAYIKQLVTNTYKLGEAADGTGKYPASLANDSLFAKLLAKGDPAAASTFDNTTDSLEALSDAIAAVVALLGAVNTAAATGAVTDTDVIMAYVKQLVTNTVKLAEIADGTGVYPESVAEDSILAKILSKANPAVATSFDNTTDSLEAISDSLAAAGATLLGALNTAAATGPVTDADVIMAYVKQIVTNTYRLAEAADGTDAYPASAAEDSLFAKLLAKGNPAVATTFDNTTDSLEAIRDRVDAVHAVPTADASDDVLVRDVVGRKTDAAVYAVATTKSVMAMLKGLLGTRLVATGTFTTSSATVPADTGRTEGNDYFKGMMLMPLTGSAALQPRPIRQYTATTDVFTLDEPFTAAPGLVTYVVIDQGYPIQRLLDIFTETNASLELAETGASTTTDGTEQTVYIVNTPAAVFKPLALQIDTTNMVSGDQLEVRTYYKVVSGGSFIKRSDVVWSGAQDPALKTIELSPNRHGIKVTITRLAGTDRAYAVSALYEG